MISRAQSLLAVIAGVAMLALAGGAYAACCNVPTGHEVRVPSVVIGGTSNGSGGCSSCGSCSSCGGDHGGHHGGHGDFSGSFQGNSTVSVTGSFSNTVNGSNVFSGASNAFGLGGVVNGSAGYYGGGGSSFYVDYNSGYIPNLSVDAGATTAAVQTPYQATRTLFRIVAIQAVCIDDREVPHPASQVTPDKEIADTYEGELFRCIAGARMQYTLAEFKGQANFDHGQTITCNKHEALYKSLDGKVACRPEKPARDCNERSLLRRYGAGVKILKMMWTETYTAYRTEMRQVQAEASVQGMVIDGGVGGVAH